MLKRKMSPSILAKASTGRPKVNRLYYMVDLSTFNVSLHQSLDSLHCALYTGLRGVTLDVNQYRLFRKIRYNKPILVNNRFIVGKTESLYLRLLKRDRENLATMAVDTPILSPLTESLPTILGDL